MRLPIRSEAFLFYGRGGVRKFAALRHAAPDDLCHVWGFMKRLLKYLKNYIMECICAPLFKMLEASFELFVPLVIASLIDKGIKLDDTDHIRNCFILLIILAVVGLISAVLAQFFAARAAVGFSSGLRHDLFDHLLSLSFREIDGLGSSTMMTRMTSDVNQAQTGVNMFLRLFLRSPFVVFGAMIMAFTIDIHAALIFVVMIVVLFFVVGAIMKSNIPMLKKAQEGLDEILMLTRENLSGARVIRAFCKEDREIDNFHKRNEELLTIQKRAGIISGALNPLTYMTVNLGIIVLIYTGALKVDLGTLSQGQVVALYNYMSQILVELIKLANLIITLNKALASANRISDVFEISPSMKDGDGSGELPSDNDVAVRFENVSFGYNESGDEALSDISFTVLKGQTIGIIGGTGSGKTTLVNLIPRFYDALRGNVYVFGRDVRDYRISEIRDLIGMVMQKPALFTGSIADNLRFGNVKASYRELEDAIHTAAADDVIKAKGDLNAGVEQNGKNLSGGQRQRLTIARAVAKKAPILILDDPASALDHATEKILNENIRGLRGDTTIFIVSQRASSVMDADNIIVLDDGEMAGSGTHDELLKDCEVYREIYYAQFPDEKEVV